MSSYMDVAKCGHELRFFLIFFLSESFVYLY
jgi:hypothetical protein